MLRKAQRTLPGYDRQNPELAVRPEFVPDWDDRRPTCLMLVGIRTGRQEKSRLDQEWANVDPDQKISWNFFVGQLNYSCQPELDVDLQTMTDPQTLGDDELLRLTRAGDESAFTVLYRRHQERVYRFALQMSGSESIADDVTQEVFLALMRESSRFDSSRGLLSSYLYGVARNHVRRHLELGRFQISLDEDSGEEPSFLEPIVAPGDLLADLTLQEGLSALRLAILTLPLHYREVVALCDLEEMSYEEAAHSIGCAVGTIRSRLHRAHALLIQKLRESNEPSSEVSRNRVSRCLS